MLGFTIDSIKLFIDKRELGALNFRYLSGLISPEKKKGKYYVWNEGYYKNLRIKYSEDKGVYVSGSISNFYKGHISLLPQNELQTAVEKLGHELNLNLHNARLYRCDIALNIQTNKPANEYTHHLFTDLSRFKRLEQDDGLRFQSKSKVFAFYNKGKELKDKKGISKIEDLLRLELRLLNGIGKALDIKMIKMEDLYDPENYLKFVNLFQYYFNKIKKQTVEYDNVNELIHITSKNLSDFLKRQGIARLGGEKEVYRLIDQFDKTKKFKNATTKYRCRKMVNEFSKDQNLTKLHPLAEEINLKVEEECKKELELYS